VSGPHLSCCCCFNGNVWLDTRCCCALSSSLLQLLVGQMEWWKNIPILQYKNWSWPSLLVTPSHSLNLILRSSSYALVKSIWKNVQCACFRACVVRCDLPSASSSIYHLEITVRHGKQRHKEPSLIIGTTALHPRIDDS
jgi:hypothetical protein